MFDFLGQNVKREQGRKVQLGNVSAAKVISDVGMFRKAVKAFLYKIAIYQPHIHDNYVH